MRKHRELAAKNRPRAFAAEVSDLNKLSMLGTKLKSLKRSLIKTELNTKCISRYPNGRIRIQHVAGGESLLIVESVQASGAAAATTIANKLKTTKAGNI